MSAVLTVSPENLYRSVGPRISLDGLCNTEAQGDAQSSPTADSKSDFPSYEPRSTTKYGLSTLHPAQLSESSLKKSSLKEAAETSPKKGWLIRCFNCLCCAMQKKRQSEEEFIYAQYD